MRNATRFLTPQLHYKTLNQHCFHRIFNLHYNDLELSKIQNIKVLCLRDIDLDPTNLPFTKHTQENGSKRKSQLTWSYSFFYDAISKLVLESHFSTTNQQPSLTLTPYPKLSAFHNTLLDSEVTLPITFPVPWGRTLTSNFHTLPT